MGLIRRLIERRSNDISSEYFWMNERLNSYATSGITVNPDTAMTISAVFACVSRISSIVASLPLNVHRRRKSGGSDVVTDHPVYERLCVEPNREQNSYEFREMIQSHLCLRGNGIIFKDLRADGQWESLTPLNPSRVEVRRENGEIVYDYFPIPDDVSSIGNLTNIIRIPSRYIWHIRGLSTSGLIGLSPITAAREAIGLSKGAERFGSQFFANKPIPGIILKHPYKLSSTAKDRLKQSVQEFSESRRHSVMVLEEGMDATTMGLTNADSQFLETRAFQIEDICRFFDVPPYLIHHQRDKAATFASSEQLSLNFVIYSMVAPWLVRWEKSAEQALFTERERSRYFIKFNVNALLRGDYKSRMQGYALGRQWGLLSANDCRELEDMNPREGGDLYIDDPKNITGQSDREQEPPTTPVGTKEDI